MVVLLATISGPVLYIYMAQSSVLESVIKLIQFSLRLGKVANTFENPLTDLYIPDLEY